VAGGCRGRSRLGSVRNPGAGWFLEDSVVDAEVVFLAAGLDVHEVRDKSGAFGAAVGAVIGKRHDIGIRTFWIRIGPGTEKFKTDRNPVTAGCVLVPGGGG
jgi:hypothetical protein